MRELKAKKYVVVETAKFFMGLKLFSSLGCFAFFGASVKVKVKVIR